MTDLSKVNMLELLAELEKEVALKQLYLIKQMVSKRLLRFYLYTL